MKELLDASAVDLAARIRAGEVSPVEVVEAHIARIEAVNPLINALVADRFERARAEARAAEERVRRASDPGELPPLLGVPCTVKEFFAVEGLPRTGGLVRRRHWIAERDATVVRRLRTAGAIVLGVTNVPEGGLWLETHNRVYGRTSNPWDLRRTPGGSSGGEAAVIAAGGAPFGVGSDIGGSIRLPAAFCGIFGHKPTGRLVPNTGQFPGAIGPAGAYLVSGPMTRRAADLLPLLRLMAGPDGEDPLCEARPIEPADDLEPRDLTVFVVEESGRTRPGRAMRWALERAATALGHLGARVERLTVPRLRRAVEIWAAMLAEGSETPYTHVLGDGQPISVVRELLRVPFRRSPFTAQALLIAGLGGVVGRLPGAGRRLAAEAEALRDELEGRLGPRGVILHPPHPRPAPRHGEAWRTMFNVGYTCIFNVLELPATQVPVGFDRGLPIGVQVIGARGRDALTIGVARVLEATCGGWVCAHPEALGDPLGKVDRPPAN